MKSKKYSLETEDDAEATLVEPRFDERAMETARPVVPLSQVTSADLYQGAQAGGPRFAARRYANGWSRGVIIMMVVVALLAAAATAAVYRSIRTVAPSPAAQTVVETNAAAEPETAKAEPGPAVETPRPAKAEESVTATESVKTATAKSPREPEPRSVAPAREGPEVSARKDNERPAPVDEKLVERARKEEQKRARREEKEAERLADRHGDSEKREETRPRLVGIYTERRRP